MELSFVCYGFFSTCLAFAVKGLVGFGDPLIFTPLLSVCLPNNIITPAFAPISPLLNGRIVWKNRKHFNARIVLPVSCFNMLGIIPGTWLLKFGQPQWLKLLAGMVIIGLGIEMLTRKTDAPGGKQNPVIRSAVAFCSGVMAALFGMNMLFLAYMERVVASREEFRANACFVLFLENLFRVVLYTYQGLFSRESLWLTLVVFPAAFVGMKVGALLDKKINDRLLHQFIVYVFILGGVSTVACALLQIL